MEIFMIIILISNLLILISLCLFYCLNRANYNKYEIDYILATNQISYLEDELKEVYRDKKKLENKIVELKNHYDNNKLYL